VVVAHTARHFDFSGTRRRAALSAVLVLALAGAGAGMSVGPATAATAPGSSAGEAFGASGSVPSDTAELDALAQSGATEYRTDAAWTTAEPVAPVRGMHTYVWASFDAIAATLAEHGLRWFPILDYSPAWASSDGSEFGAPTDPSAFAAYAAAFAARYGVGGSFWAAHPELPALPVAQYEIWNEENNPTFWHQQSTAPAQYATLLLAARGAIKAAVPSARVVLGGVLDAGTDALAFLAAMQRAHPGVLKAIDAIGYHPYQENLAVILQRVAALRSLLRRDGARGVPIEITEIDANDNLVSAASWSQAIAGLDTTLAASPSCHVSSIFAYMAGPPTGNSGADAGGWFTLFQGDGSLNAVGLAYLDSMHRAVSHIATRRKSLCT